MEALLLVGLNGNHKWYLICWPWRHVLSSKIAVDFLWTV